MVNYHVGKKIKELRTYYNIYQEELADGICSQGAISKIEKDEIMPSAHILYELAKRLGVDLNYLFGTSSSPRLDYIKSACEDITKEIRNRNYEEALRMIKNEKRNPLFNSTELKQFLLWREGICVFGLEKNHQKGFDLLNEALSLTPTTNKNFSEIQLDIMGSLAIFNSQLKEHEKTKEIYLKIFALIKKMPNPIEPNLFIRLLYNSAVNDHFLGDYQSSIKKCDEAIAVCKSNMTMYLLAQTFFQRGESYYSYKKDGSEALKWMNKSLNLFEVLEDQGAMDYVEGEIKKIDKHRDGSRASMALRATETSL
ncbi:XRE family transcriptional regulator [Anaerobacillus alkaliphilus]|uniref:XRE family transcriptional regulator n=1 Tax=Anaerobacillus alkaliphilus TaxID=1548597 RepID=A0A4V1LGL9_9BACI|nr:helix-turn-helix domain-containing protein [Anaerobacillus alkaliphilus]RXJ02219.1 XRE family transcriptional regulator [Anaerobacillus alkaliphilus]